ncbi:MAG: bifunctional adenosylcobinamide kinase/adenosylcobinamide-phosphate guanylyltransferase [Oscillospiraceae bacterium]|nr:bifunctional adenosylcobinamide kinase/adenosylcobinamide-phosphate guanylyltransferase [Oscillospiraceae bacterium]
MILIVGGHAAGKLDYVRTLGYGDEDISGDVFDEKPVLCGLQDIAAAAPERAESLLPALLRKSVVVCDEVGSGVIPLEKRDREAREATGRLCVLLAREAEKVVRVVAGIPVVLKG